MTTQFLVEISQYIKFGDLTNVEVQPSADDDVRMIYPESPLDSMKPPVLFIDMPSNTEEDTQLSKQEEDALLKEIKDVLDDVGNCARSRDPGTTFRDRSQLR